MVAVLRRCKCLISEIQVFLVYIILFSDSAWQRFRNFKSELCFRMTSNKDSDTDNVIEKGKNLEKEESPIKVHNKKPEFPEAPTTCCMSGCANCVWLDYAEKLTEYFKDGGEQAMKEINEKVDDPMIKAFLLLELRTRQKQDS